MKYVSSAPTPPAQVTLTADLVVVRPDGCVLLIRRRKHPFRDMWALPGGKLQPGETIEQCAVRELREETGIEVSVSALCLVGLFSEPDRDPRGRFVSVVYRVVVGRETGAQAGGDAWDAVWFYCQDLPWLAFDHNNLLTSALAWEL